MRALLATVLWLLLVSPAGAASIKLAWDANDPADGTIGYRIRYSDSTPEGNPREIDVGNVTTTTVPNLTAGLAYFFVAVAYNAAGQVSLPSNQVVGTAQDPPPDPCAFPLGPKAVQVFVTGKLNKTGSGGAGSKAFITFQAASLNSPVVFASIRANGTDIADSVTEGTNLHAIGSLWFTVPSGPATYTFSVYARNLAGCERDQSTGFALTLP